MEPHMIKDHRLSMRVPSALRNALDKLAESQQRSTASYVQAVLAAHVAEQTITHAEINAQSKALKRSVESRLFGNIKTT